jgi:sugar/nucleoside kinase (ribokinase family)
LGARAALVAKIGGDEAGHRLQETLMRLKVDLQWLRTAPGQATTTVDDPEDEPRERRVDRGADLALRLDELPPPSIKAAITVVSGYSLSVEPARSAAMGALLTAAGRGGRAGLLLEAELLWWTNARITRRVLEPALASAGTVALRALDATILFGPVGTRQAVRLLSDMGPRTIYATEPDGAVLLKDGARIHHYPALTAQAQPRDRFAGPAAFWLALARGVSPQRAAAESVRYAFSVRRPGAPRQLAGAL